MKSGNNSNNNILIIILFVLIINTILLAFSVKLSYENKCSDNNICRMRQNKLVEWQTSRNRNRNSKNAREEYATQQNHPYNYFQYPSLYPSTRK